jgi:hypothetical protein
MAEPIIVDGRYLSAGHRWAWRRGVVVEALSDDVNRHSQPVRVRLERRGRERQYPEAVLPDVWLLRRTAELEAQLGAHGLLVGRDDAVGLDLNPINHGLAAQRLRGSAEAP